MIRVDRMSLQLPPELAPHTHTIVNRIGEALAGTEVSGDRPIDAIAVPAIAVDPLHGPGHAADAIATAVCDAVNRGSGT